jgi:diadenosine tetraphosphate (Ap4A) HIT family hydrolase
MCCNFSQPGRVVLKRKDKMDNWKQDRITSAVRGENPTVLMKMKSGFAVISDTQFLPGTCILLAYPRVGCLNDLSLKKRGDFLVEMSLIGDAITTVCQPLRINYDILGNTDAYLHAHIIPRYAWEEDDLRRGPVWRYPRENWSREEYQYNELKHGEMKHRLSEILMVLMING